MPAIGWSLLAGCLPVAAPLSRAPDDLAAVRLEAGEVPAPEVDTYAGPLPPLSTRDRRTITERLEAAAEPTGLYAALEAGFQAAGSSLLFTDSPEVPALRLEVVGMGYDHEQGFYLQVQPLLEVDGRLLAGDVVQCRRRAWVASTGPVQTAHDLRMATESDLRAALHELAMDCGLGLATQVQRALGR